MGICNFCKIFQYIIFAFGHLVFAILFILNRIAETNSGNCALYVRKSIQIIILIKVLSKSLKIQLNLGKL